jgi:hypothetical protein
MRALAALAALTISFATPRIGHAQIAPVAPVPPEPGAAPAPPPEPGAAPAPVTPPSSYVPADEAPPDATCSACPSAPAPTRAVPTGSRKNPSTALALSLGVTAGSLGLLIAGGSLKNDAGLAAVVTPATIGFLVGPSLGHWYSGRVVNRGMGLRALGAVVGAVGIGMAVGCVDSGLLDEAAGERHSDSCALPGIIAVGGSALYLVGTLYEIADAPRAAHEYNRRHGWEVQVVPTVPTAGGGPVGVAVSGRF